MNWNQLTKEQKAQFRNYCDEKFGKTNVLSETGEPLYFDEGCNMIDTKIVIDLLFVKTQN